MQLKLYIEFMQYKPKVENKQQAGKMYPIQSPEQLAAYLRAMRKSKGLTQSDIGRALGVSAARVSEIEKDPGSVGFGQLQRLLHLLGTRLVLETSGDAQRIWRDQTPHGEW